MSRATVRSCDVSPGPRRTALTVEKPWGGHHDREAIRRYYELAAELVGNGDMDRVINIAHWAHTRGRYESLFRRELRAAGLDAARIDREVRVVRARAEGREVVTVSIRHLVKLGYTAIVGSFDSKVVALDVASKLRGASVVKITRRRIVRAKDPS